jgi:succinate-semialdehyde dehydrogenase/glutarate-semialdehyde dehydrogenase
MNGPIISVRTGLYIDGAWRTASDGAEIEVLDPASEEVIASVASASIEDGLAAVDAAHRTARRPLSPCAAMRSRASPRVMTARAEDFGKLMSQENGKA